MSCLTQFLDRNPHICTLASAPWLQGAGLASVEVQEVEGRPEEAAGEEAEAEGAEGTEGAEGAEEVRHNHERQSSKMLE